MRRSSRSGVVVAVACALLGAVVLSAVEASSGAQREPTEHAMVIALDQKVLELEEQIRQIRIAHETQAVELGRMGFTLSECQAEAAKRRFGDNVIAARERLRVLVGAPLSAPFDPVTKTFQWEQKQP